MSRIKALIIDDEPDILELLTITLTRMGLDCVSAKNISQALKLIESQDFDICLTDMRLPDGDGLEVLRFLQSQKKDIPVAVITAHGNIETAIESMKLGAFDFLSKPIDLNQLRNLVGNAVATNQQSTGDLEQDSSKSITTARQFIGSTKIMKQLKQLILKVAKSQAPVFIRGESGTGKEVVARLIHKNGSRKHKPFIAVNCGAIPSELMESEFFGHVKGSFTGANSDKQGLFQAADGGTLFLDEIADLPLAMQVKLLRAIQERTVRPVGAHKEIQVDVRLLSASHKDLSQMVALNSFRQDLFYRINVIEVFVPPLRDRVEDIPELIEYFLSRLAQRNGVKHYTITNDAIKKLQTNPFPGNIRELENNLERLVTLSSDGIIDASDLILTMNSAQSSSMSAAEFKRGRQYQPLYEYLEDIERLEIEKALAETGGNKTAAAELLGVSFRTIRYKCKKLGID